MFRTPRDNANSADHAPLKPSTGRPPTPPNYIRLSHRLHSTMAPRNSAKPLTPRPNSKSNVLATTRQNTKKTPSTKTPTIKISAKPNTSILNFFKKIDSPLNDNSIFISQGSQAQKLPSASALLLDSEDEDVDDLYNGGYDERYNEAKGSMKRQKTSRDGTLVEDPIRDSVDIRNTGMDGLFSDDSSPEKEPIAKISKPKQSKSKKSRRKGPFLSDSESDYEIGHKLSTNTPVVAEKRELRTRFLNQPEGMDEVAETKPEEQEQLLKNKRIEPEVKTMELANTDVFKRGNKVPLAEAQAKWEALRPKSSRSPSNSSVSVPIPPPNGMESSRSPVDNIPAPMPAPLLKKETTGDDWARFDDVEDFPDDVDEFADGEEFVERKWMQEQARLEAAEEVQEEEIRCLNEGVATNSPGNEVAAACPICDASLGGVTPDEATRHVNGCLDGNSVPLPAPVKMEIAEVKLMPEGAKNRFARKAGIARPGQANPFNIGSDTLNSGSAFSKLMSGHAEDAAWTTAAAAEHASRGKPAYERTCPFYKIMPGFFICVDAFRYGAVQGCNAYFLSHFHSDHYVGLTSSWCHGPIYCSKVTANLIKQQLRVDPKWLVPLDFEEKFEVPGTQGVDITMIPANHCPGSSLFLFEKVIGSGKTPKIHRVLHCGDFRACPAHIAHPLLMPDVSDTISGKIKQQKIDVCYLDTTYLNPKYSFPCQDDVIKACADMCISLKKDRAGEGDAWEVAKRERAGVGMVKFVNSSTVIKAEDNSIAMELDSSKNEKLRGRLLVICGTYSIGKERICMGIARALDCKIWAPPGKMRICAALEDPELMSRMTDDPKEAQIHMQMMMEIRAETLQEYLNSYKPHFSRVVGFRPSGWNYRPPNSRFTDSPTIPTIIRSPNWKSSYTLQDLVPQRGSTREASCFGVPYSEHSSFRELTLFVCSLRIEKVVPTVNVGSAATRAKMKAWIERWLAERRKNGCLKLGNGDGEVAW